MTKFVLIGEAAKRLGVDPQWLRKNSETLGLTVVTLPSGHRRYVGEEIDMISAKIVSGKTCKLAEWQQ